MNSLSSILEKFMISLKTRFNTFDLGFIFRLVQNMLKNLALKLFFELVKFCLFFFLTKQLYNARWQLVSSPLSTFPLAKTKSEFPFLKSKSHSLLIKKLKIPYHLCDLTIHFLLIRFSISALFHCLLPYSNFST